MFQLAPASTVPRGCPNHVSVDGDGGFVKGVCSWSGESDVRSLDDFWALEAYGDELSPSREISFVHYNDSFPLTP